MIFTTLFGKQPPISADNWTKIFKLENKLNWISTGSPVLLEDDQKENHCVY